MGELRASRGVSPWGRGPPGQGAEGGAEALGLRLALASVVLQDPCAQGSPRGHSGPWSPGDCNPGAPHLSADCRWTLGLTSWPWLPARGGANGVHGCFPETWGGSSEVIARETAAPLCGP